MNNTDEYWEIDGVSLHQHGWSVTTFGGGRYDLPARRGENITLAYRPGQVHRPKLADARVISLVMWLTGSDPATGAAVDDPRLRFNDSWDFLRRLVWKPAGGQVDLTRRWWLSDDDGIPQLVTATGKAEIGDSMTPTMTGPTRAEFTMTLLMADPYFYGSPVTTTIPRGSSASVVNAGHDIAAHGQLQIEFMGPLTNPKLTNLTPDTDTWVLYKGSIPANGRVRLSVNTFEAWKLLPEFWAPESKPPPSAYVLGEIVNFGQRYWMSLLPGANLLSLSADSGTGHAVVTFRPPYV